MSENAYLFELQIELDLFTYRRLEKLAAAKGVSVEEATNALLEEWVNNYPQA